jgi:DNA-directed RNA polymerase subunit RPC12/RpoP
MLKFLQSSDKKRKFIYNDISHEIVEIEQAGSGKIKKKIGTRKPLQKMNRRKHPEQAIIIRVQELGKQGMGSEAIARELNLSRSVFYNHYRYYAPVDERKRRADRGIGRGTKYGRQAREKSGIDPMTVTSAGNAYMCQDCLREFVSVLDIGDAHCPNCNSENLAQAKV